jgi:hypothetical protein
MKNPDLNPDLNNESDFHLQYGQIMDLPTLQLVIF